ncbi:MAG: DUF4375 domain-containing protein [Faecousia sp.]
MPQQIERQNETYRAMTAEQLAMLSDEELFTAAEFRINCKMNGFEDSQGGYDALSPQQKVFYAVNILEMEVNNGGLCQFFVNSSRAVAPYISDYLGIIGANGHKNLFDHFICKYKINLNDLSSFQIQRAKDFATQFERYPFDEYDNAFYQLDSLAVPLTAYIRTNIDAF